MFLCRLNCVESKKSYYLERPKKDLEEFYQKGIQFLHFTIEWGKEIWDIFYSGKCKKPTSAEEVYEFFDKYLPEKLPIRIPDINESKFASLIKNKVFGDQKKWPDLGKKTEISDLKDLDNLDRFEIFVHLCYGSIFSYLSINVLSLEENEKEAHKNPRWLNICESFKTFRDFFSSIKYHLTSINCDINEDINNSLYSILIPEKNIIEVRDSLLLDFLKSFLSKKYQENDPVICIIQKMQEFFVRKSKI